MKFLHLILGLFLIIITSPIYADYNQETYDLIDNYYLTFEAFDMNSYLETQDLRDYTIEELEIKKDNIDLMWENVQPLYHHVYNLDVTFDENVAIVTYDLEAGMGTYNSDDEFNYEMEMGAILSNINNEWKILKIMPLTQLDELIELINVEESLIILNESLENNFVNETYLYLSNETDISEEIIVENNTFKIVNDTNELPTDIIKDEINCEFKTEYINNINGINIKDFISENIYDMLIGNFGINILIDEDKKYLIEINDGVLNLINSTTKTIKYSVITDSCTILSIHDKTITPMQAYNNNLITIKGETIGTKVKILFGKILFEIFNFFKSGNDIENIIIEGEDFKLLDSYKYNFVGKTSRGPGELYLGNGKSSANIEFNSNSNKIIYLYVKITDDKLHQDDTRSVDLIFNDNTISYIHKSENTITPNSVWTWKYLGEIEIKEGTNNLEIYKPKQTSAAFIMDKLVLFDEKVEISEIDD